MTTINNMIQRIKLVNMINKYHNTNYDINYSRRPCLGETDIIKINHDQTFINHNQDISEYIDYKTLFTHIECAKNNLCSTKFWQDATNEECQTLLMQYLLCGYCRDLIIALRSNVDFDKYVIYFTSIVKIPYDSFVNVPCLNSKNQLLKFVKELALSNNITIIGSAVIDALSEIEANDLDIVTNRKIAIDFITKLECFFAVRSTYRCIITYPYEEKITDNISIGLTKYHKIIKFQITHNNIKLDVDVISHEDHESMPIEFGATSFVLNRSNKHDSLDIKINEPIIDVLSDVKNKILRFAPQIVSLTQIVSITPHLIHQIFKKQADGWTISGGIPANIHECITRAITNKELITICNDTTNVYTQRNLSNDIWKMIVEYDGNCRDNYKGSFCYRNPISHANAIIDNGCDNSISKDYMFVHMCCKKVQCITCAIKHYDNVRRTKLNYQLNDICAGHKNMITFLMRKTK